MTVPPSWASDVSDGENPFRQQEATDATSYRNPAFDR